MKNISTRVTWVLRYDWTAQFPHYKPLNHAIYQLKPPPCDFKQQNSIQALFLFISLSLATFRLASQMPWQMLPDDGVDSTIRRFIKEKAGTMEIESESLAQWKMVDARGESASIITITSFRRYPLIMLSLMIHMLIAMIYWWLEPLNYD